MCITITYYSIQDSYNIIDLIIFENIRKLENRTSVYAFHMKILVCLDPKL